MDEAAVVAVAAEVGHEDYSVLVDLASGTVAGCSGIIVGQPFDTVRGAARSLSLSLCSSSLMGRPCCLLTLVVGAGGYQIKVRLQTHGAFYKGSVDCVRQTVSAASLS